MGWHASAWVVTVLAKGRVVDGVCVWRWVGCSTGHESMALLPRQLGMREEPRGFMRVQIAVLHLGGSDQRGRGIVVIRMASGSMGAPENWFWLPEGVIKQKE